MDKTLKSYLEKRNIKFKIQKHPPVFTVEEHHKLIKNTPNILHTKNLFLKDIKGNFYLVSMYANKRLNTKTLAKKLNTRKLHFASSNELKSHLNLLPGSVSIFGMIYAKDVSLILDKQVWDSPIVGFHPNINTATLELKHKDLEKFYNSLKAKKQILDLK